MSDLVQYQNVFRIAKNDTASNGTQSRVTKRNRQSVSCMACRTRKLKCDRQVPCTSCSKRRAGASCSYSNNGRNRHEPRDDGSRTSEAQLRLQKLEDMVTSFMQTTKDSSETRTEKAAPRGVAINQCLKDLSVQSSPPTAETSSGGHLDVQGLETNYLGATHWAAILENIRDIQGFLGPEADGNEEAPSALPDDPDIAIDTTQSLTLPDVCNSLPPRPVANELLRLFFDARYLQTPVLHWTKFSREIGSQNSTAGGQETINALDSPAKLLLVSRAGQALVTGKYHKARPYSVEAVLLFAQCKFKQQEDPEVNAWMLMGIGTRLAMRMGYHRDPRYLKHISAFEGEMRRRTFFVVEAFDLLHSFQAGMPTIIHEEECDIELPSNLFDEDFDEDCEVLPPSRPPTESTKMLYFCYKGRYIKILKRISRHALSLKKPSNKSIMKLDAELHEVHSDVPASLRIRPLDSSFIDHVHTMPNRLNINMIYLKSLCVLHRIYLSHDRSNPTFAYSRSTCTYAALQILKHQADLYVATQPGGKLFNERWMLSGLMLHDFLLAAMITCLDLYESHKSPTTSPEDVKAQIKQYDALLLSHEIWTSRRAVSRDARRATNVLAAMLSKVPRPNVEVASFHSPQDTFGVSQTPVKRGDLVGSTAISSESSSWDTTTFDIPSLEFPADDHALDFNWRDPLTAVFNDSDNIDWGTWDQYLFDRGDFGDVSLN